MLDLRPLSAVEFELTAVTTPYLYGDTNKSLYFYFITNTNSYNRSF